MIVFSEALIHPLTADPLRRNANAMVIDMRRRLPHFPLIAPGSRSFTIFVHGSEHVKSLTHRVMYNFAWLTPATATVAGDSYDL